MDTNRLPKQALQYKPKGRRNIGRPRKRWRDQLHLEDQVTGNTSNPSWTCWWSIYLRKNSDLCHLQHKLIGFYNRDEKCLLRGTDWVFKWSSLRFAFKGLNNYMIRTTLCWWMRRRFISIVITAALIRRKKLGEGRPGETIYSNRTIGNIIYMLVGNAPVIV